MLERGCGYLTAIRPPRQVRSCAGVYSRNGATRPWPTLRRRWTRVGVGIPLVSKGNVARNFGGLRAWVTASKPDASLIKVGSLNAVPMNEIPTGVPKENPIATLMMG